MAAMTARLRLQMPMSHHEVTRELCFFSRLEIGPWGSYCSPRQGSSFIDRFSKSSTKYDWLPRSLPSCVPSVYLTLVRFRSVSSHMYVSGELAPRW